MSKVGDRTGTKKAAMARPAGPAMKLGALGYEPSARMRRRVRWGPTLLAGLLVFAGAVMFAAWVGGSLGQLALEADQRMRRAVDQLGFGVEAVMVAGVGEGPRSQAVRRAAGISPGSPIFAVDPEVVRARVRAMEWVRDATVLRLWPDQVMVLVEPRGELARWREGGQDTVVDAAGARVLSLDPEAFTTLPVVEGDGAGPAAAALFEALRGAPAVAQRLQVARFEGGRRWRLVLRSGSQIDLPARDVAAALARVELLHRRDRLLDAAPARYDLRDPNRLVASPLAGPIGRFGQGPT